MAFSYFTGTVGTRYANGQYSSEAHPVQLNAPSATTVAADVATLVADGDTPTQEHVDTLNTDWTAFAASYSSYNNVVGLAAPAQDFSVAFGANITNINQVKGALDAILQAAKASGKFATS